MIQRSRKSFKGECENGRLLSKLGRQCSQLIRSFSRKSKGGTVRKTLLSILGIISTISEVIRAEAETCFL